MIFRNCVADTQRVVVLISYDMKSSDDSSNLTGLSHR
jgi:hypothetical protein